MKKYSNTIYLSNRCLWCDMPTNFFITLCLAPSSRRRHTYFVFLKYTVNRLQLPRGRFVCKYFLQHIAPNGLTTYKHVRISSTVHMRNIDRRRPERDLDK
jgi:hypothetical protein